MWAAVTTADIDFWLLFFFSQYFSGVKSSLTVLRFNNSFGSFSI